MRQYPDELGGMYAFVSGRSIISTQMHSIAIVPSMLTSLQANRSLKAKSTPPDRNNVMQIDHYTYLINWTILLLLLRAVYGKVFVNLRLCSIYSKMSEYRNFQCSRKRHKIYINNFVFWSLRHELSPHWDVFLFNITHIPFWRNFNNS